MHYPPLKQCLPFLLRRLVFDYFGPPPPQPQPPHERVEQSQGDGRRGVHPPQVRDDEDGIPRSVRGQGEEVGAEKAADEGGGEVEHCQGGDGLHGCTVTSSFISNACGFFGDLRALGGDLQVRRAVAVRHEVVDVTKPVSSVAASGSLMCGRVECPPEQSDSGRAVSGC